MEKVLFTELCTRLNKTPGKILSMGLDGTIRLWMTIYGCVDVSECYCADAFDWENIDLRNLDKKFQPLKPTFWGANRTFAPCTSHLADLMRNPSIILEEIELVGEDSVTGSFTSFSLEGKIFYLGVNDLFAYESDVLAFERTLATSAPEAPTPTADLSSKREKTLLKVIGSLLTMKYQASSYFNGNGEVIASAMAEQFDTDLAAAGFADDGLKIDTIRKTVIKQAFEAIAENRKE
jgi:hypothetical protein